MGKTYTDTHSATRSVREECSDRVGEQNKKKELSVKRMPNRQHICMGVTFSLSEPDVIPEAPLLQTVSFGELSDKT